MNGRPSVNLQIVQHNFQQPTSACVSRERRELNSHAEFGVSLARSWLNAAGPSASEREICLWEGLREGVFSEVFIGFQRFFVVFRGFQRFFSEIFRGPLRDPLRGRFPSQALGLVAPNRVAPWTFSNTCWLNQRQKAIPVTQIRLTICHLSHEG